MELLSGDGDEPWVGFISTEDALQVVERAAGSRGVLPPDLARWIIELKDPESYLRDMVCPLSYFVLKF